MDRRSQSKTFPVIGQTSFLELHRISRKVAPLINRYHLF